MNTSAGSSIGISSRPRCYSLATFFTTTSKNSSIFRFSSPNYLSKLNLHTLTPSPSSFPPSATSTSISACNNKSISSSSCSNRKSFYYISDSIHDLSRPNRSKFLRSYCSGATPGGSGNNDSTNRINRSNSFIAKANVDKASSTSSDFFRKNDYSTSSIESKKVTPSFEQIYIRRGLNKLNLNNLNVNTSSALVDYVEGRKSPPPIGLDLDGVNILEHLDELNLSDVKEAFLSEPEKEIHEKEEKRKKREESEIEKEAWKLLEDAIVNYSGKPVGTVAAKDSTAVTELNYDQVFIRDFVPSALAFLLRGDSQIVKNFLLHTLRLQSWEKTVDCYSPGQGLMPASYKVKTTVSLDGIADEALDPDFGESAIGRVAPVDSGLWWIILLRAYGKITGDYSLQERVDVQTGIRLILKLCLTDGFDMFPTLLVTDGSCMIDRRMGIHGHPLEIQALFYSALRCSREMVIVNESTKSLVAALNNRLSALSFHMREYYWVDINKINEIYRYKTEEYSTNATNKFNIYPEQIPSWLVDWIPEEEGGYFIGNVQPAHMDFRFFTLGNLWSIISALGSPQQNEGLLNLIEAKWEDLIADMPLKICYPALECEEWRIITGSDPKNTPWSYHNGGSWPTLLWQFTLACIKMKRSDLARKAVDLAEKRLSKDRWPEYYDTKKGKFVGKQSRLFQSWTIAGFLTSKLLLDNLDLASVLFWEEDYELLEKCVCALSKNGQKKCSRGGSRSQD